MDSLSMRFAIALLMALSLALAGCVQVADQEGGNETDRAGGDGGTGETGKTGMDSPGDDNATDDDGNGTKGGDGSDDDEPDLECHEHDRPVPPHPDEQQVDAKSDLKCPAHFFVADEGEGSDWQLPRWSVGDWWRYEHELMDQSMTTTSCSHQSKETVVADDKTVMGVPVYTVEVVTFDCDGEPTGNDPVEQMKTKENLNVMKNSGYIHHLLLFPMREGKNWFFVAENCRDNCTIAEVKDVVHHEEGLLSDVEKWSMQWGFEGKENTEVRIDLEWSVDRRNVLLEEMWVTGFTAPISKKQLIGSSYD